MKKYRLVIDVLPDGLSEQVSRLMNEGWTCQGGIFILVSEQGHRKYFQAMVWL
jgi:hypothetical protein